MRSGTEKKEAKDICIEDEVVNLCRENQDNDYSFGADVDCQNSKVRIEDSSSEGDEIIKENYDDPIKEYEDLEFSDIIDINITRHEDEEVFGNLCEDQVNIIIQSEKGYLNTKDDPFFICNEHESVDTSQNEIDNQVDEQEVVSTSFCNDKKIIGVNKGAYIWSKGVDELTTSISDLNTPGLWDMNLSCLESVNQFSCLYEESAVNEDEVKEHDIDKPYGMFIIGKRNIFKLRQRRPKLVQAYYEPKSSSKFEKSINKIENIKIKHRRDCLKIFETENRFDILRGNAESDLDAILKVNKILITPKHSLKRCRRCNFKKRICALLPNSCKASQCFCFMCHKFGHFPKSIYCRTKN